MKQRQADGRRAAAEDTSGRHFVNVYVYTPSVADEIWRSWWRIRFRAFYITSFLFIGAIAAIALSVRMPLYFVYETFPVLALIFMERRRRRLRKETEEQYERNFRDTSPTIRVEIGNGISLVTTKNIERISFSDVERVVTLDKIILITARGGRVAAMKKDGFLEGTPEECTAYIREQKRACR